MASDLLSIASSGARAARIALDLTAQNIANASSEGYVRRSVQLEELASTGGFNRVGDVSLSGVRLGGVTRHADAFRQAEVRRTGADAARGDAEVAGLENIQSAVEQTGVFPAIVQFEASLRQLAGDPVDPSLRAAVIEDARTMTRSFNIAATSLDAVGASLRFEATDGASQVNLFAGELARVNLRLARAADSSSDQAALLDQRDSLLERMSEYSDVSTSFAANGTVEVRLGGASGPQLVSGGTATPLAMATAADGTISFTLGGGPVTLTAGSLTGKAQALVKLADVRDRLDTLAAGLAATINAAQAGGIALDGSAGQPLFAGTDAASLALGLRRRRSDRHRARRRRCRQPRLRKPHRHAQCALAAANPAGAMDALIFDISGTVAGRTVTRDALRSIAGNASIALEAQAGVNLDQEATNLIRYQQAFQASGRAMQVASTIFDTLLELR